MTFTTNGNNAFLEKNGRTIYTTCVAGTVTTKGDIITFTDALETFSLTYPSVARLSGGEEFYIGEWSLTIPTSGLLLAKLTIPGTIQPLTNFRDVLLTIGTSSRAEAVAGCLEPTNGGQLATSTVMIQGLNYSVITARDDGEQLATSTVMIFPGLSSGDIPDIHTGKGSFYDTVSYRAIRHSQCNVIEYTVHSTNIANYDPEQGIKKFDEVSIKNLLEAIVKSVQWL